MPPTVNPNKDFQETITGAALTPTPTVQYQSPTTPSVYPVASLVDLQMTQPEQQANDLSTQLGGLYSRLEGESAYRTQQNEALGVNSLNSTVTDLNAQIQGLANQSLALQNEANVTIPNQMQVASEGRGRTTAGLAPLTASTLRRNQIKQGEIATQALTLKSAFEAAQGRLANAQRLSDEAVKQRFDPIREEIATKMANLELILKSPAYSVAEKNRALQQQQIQEDRKRALDNQEEDTRSAQAMAAAATKNFPTDPAAQIAVRQALTLNPADPQYLQKVFGILGQYQTNPQEIEAALLDASIKREQLRQMPLAFNLDQQYKRSQIYNSSLSSQKALLEIQALKNPSGLLTSAGKPLNDTQAVSLGYARRLAEAGQVIDEIGANFTSPKNYLNSVTPNVLKGSALQKFEQAQRNFVNAVLRRESGAVISQEEFDNARRQYFPQPGDGAEVVAQKKANRDTVYQNFILQAGSPNLPSTTARQIVYQGKTYNVDAQGNMTPAN